MLREINKRKITLVLIILCVILQSVFITEVYATENLQYQNVDENGNLKIYSEAAILMERTTGKILYEKNAYEKKYPASTTKILTAILAIENCDLEEKATASRNAVFSVKPGYSIADIQEGESFTVEELLEVMMLQSANEAANILAEHVSGSIENFSKLMNDKAKEIGCQNTNFVNANGAHDPNHYSTAYDMAKIASYCMKNKTFRNIASQMECSLPTTEIWEKERNFKNTNSLMNSSSRYYYEYCTGIKTGYTTPARNCLISSANKNGFELIAIVLHAQTTENGSSARYLDTINLFNYGYNNYKIEEIYDEYGISVNSDSKGAHITSRFQYRDANIGMPSLEEIDFEDSEYSNKSESKVSKYLVVTIGLFIIGIFNKKRKRKLKKKSKKKSAYSQMYKFKYDV